jgi:hypothetical protein
MSFNKILSKRLFKMIREQNEVQQIAAPWKDIRNPDYDRQYAEDCLFYTLGPLTADPRWGPVNMGASAPEGYTGPGGPAPRWTRDEVSIAFCGDPTVGMFRKDNPRSPAYGKMGGAPLYRVAKLFAKQARGSSQNKLDRDTVEELYQTGYVAFAALLDPGADQKRGTFISWAISNLKGSMTGGVGSDARTNRLLERQGVYYITPEGHIKDRLPTLANKPKPGESSERFAQRKAKSEAAHEAAAASWQRVETFGIKSILKMTDPDQIQRASDVVKGDFRYNSSRDRSPENPFGQYSADYYMLCNELADAIRSNDQGRVNEAKEGLKLLEGKASENSEKLLGAYTGLKSAITDKSRTNAPKIASMNQKNSSTGDATEMQIAEPVAEEDPREPIQDRIFEILKLGLEVDMSRHQNVARFQSLQQELGGSGGFGQRFTSNEYRFVLRWLGSKAEFYPGKGNLRKNSSVPREGRGWWEPLEDPEIEKIPGSTELWSSIWLENDCPNMGAKAIADEMMEEMSQFNKLGIPTDRKTISKQAVSTTMNRAIMKFKLLAAIEEQANVLDEGTLVVKNGLLVVERIEDPIDLKIMCELSHSVVGLANRLNYQLLVDDLKERIGLIR